LPEIHQLEGRVEPWRIHGCDITDGVGPFIPVGKVATARHHFNEIQKLGKF